MKTIKLNKENINVIDIKLNLENYYKELNCETIDIIQLKINNKIYDFIIDDEGKLKDHYYNIALIHDYKIIDYLINDLLICNFENTNDGLIETALTDEDINNIKNWYNTCNKLIDFKHGKLIQTIEI